LAAELAAPRLEPFPEEPLFQQRSLVRRAFDEDVGERDRHAAKPGPARRIGIEMVHRDAPDLLGVPPNGPVVAAGRTHPQPPQRLGVGARSRDRHARFGFCVSRTCRPHDANTSSIAGRNM